MFWIELLVVLGAILVGARVGGAGLGTVAMIGLAILVFGFGLPPSSPPGTVLAIIVSVVAAAASMQAAGGLDLLVGVAERVLRARPAWITFMAPAVAYLFTFCAGTGHVAYAVLPVIAEVSRKAGVRPERPMSISVIASQQAITASPLSAATAGLLALLSEAGLEINGKPVELWHILAICIPATFFGCMIGAASVMFVGRELKDDPVYQERLAKGLVEGVVETPRLEGAAGRNATGAVAAFLIGALTIVVFGMFPGLRPAFPGPLDPDSLQALAVPLSMAQIIQIVMYSAAGLMMLFFGAKPTEAVRSSVGTAGVIAVISIVGLGWLGSCFFEGNKEFVLGGLKDMIGENPWVFALGLFTLSILLFSQASTVAALMPVGIALGLPATTLIPYFPAVNGYFFLPTYATIVAAVAFDRTGTTRIGKYVLNHSFMLPGVVSTVSGIIIGRVIAEVLF